MTNIRHGLSSKAGFILFVLTASTFSLFSANTFAQNQGEEYSMVLEEVIVTATKREVNVQDIAISISTLSGDDLKAMASGGADIRFLRARRPGPAAFLHSWLRQHRLRSECLAAGVPGLR